MHGLLVCRCRGGRGRGRRSFLGVRAVCWWWIRISVVSIITMIMTISKSHKVKAEVSSSPGGSTVTSSSHPSASSPQQQNGGHGHGHLHLPHPHHVHLPRPFHRRGHGHGKNEHGHDEHHHKAQHEFTQHLHPPLPLPPPPDVAKDQELAQRLPRATPAERLRFLKARNGDVEAAFDQLNAYLEWHYAHFPNDNDNNDNDNDMNNNLNNNMNSLAEDTGTGISSSSQRQHQLQPPPPPNPPPNVNVGAGNHNHVPKNKSIPNVGAVRALGSLARGSFQIIDIDTDSDTSASARQPHYTSTRLDTIELERRNNNNGHGHGYCYEGDVFLDTMSVQSQSPMHPPPPPPQPRSSLIDMDAGTQAKAGRTTTVTALRPLPPPPPPPVLAVPPNIIHRQPNDSMPLEMEEQSDTGTRMLYMTNINDASPRAKNGNNGTGNKTDNGNRICHIMPAMMQTHPGKPGYKTSEAHATDVAMYLDAQLDRYSLERITVLVDTRAGTGWPNPLATSLVGFIRHITNLLSNLFVERLEQCIVFPVPAAFVFFWKTLIAPCLDPMTRSKVVLLGGGTYPCSSMHKDMRHYMAHDVKDVDILEQRRVSLFR
jgi:hypothetical protein